MRLRDLLAAIEALKLDPETDVVLQTATDGSFDDFEVQLCTHEHEDGGVIPGPDDGGWGGKDPRALPCPVLVLDAMVSERRKSVTF